MPKNKEEKTNVMRILDREKIPYTPHFYQEGGGPEGTREYGLHVAQALGEDPDRVFKTLAARGASGEIYVFELPVAETLERRYRVYPGRMQPRGDEEAVSHGVPPDGGGF